MKFLKNSKGEYMDWITILTESFLFGVGFWASFVCLLYFLGLFVRENEIPPEDIYEEDKTRYNFEKGLEENLKKYK